MKTIGLLGGMSWESSIEYERLINLAVRKRLGGTSSADLIIRSFNFADLEALQKAGKWDEAGAILAKAAQDLEAAGARAVLICANTMHLVAGQVQDAISIPVLHIADAIGLQVSVPNPEQRDEVHRIIYEELVRGVIDAKSKRYVLDLIDEFTSAGIEGVIAGCTEIELLVKAEDLTLPYFPTAALHAAAAAKFALSN